MSKKRNTQIPEEAIECAASLKDKFVLNASVTQVVCDKEVTEPNKKNTKTVSSNNVSRPVLSTELAEGMSIKTVDGKKPQSVEKGR